MHRFCCKGISQKSQIKSDIVIVIVIMNHRLLISTACLLYYYNSNYKQTHLGESGNVISIHALSAAAASADPVAFTKSSFT